MFVGLAAWEMRAMRCCAAGSLMSGVGAARDAGNANDEGALERVE